MQQYRSCQSPKTPPVASVLRPHIKILLTAHDDGARKTAMHTTIEDYSNNIKSQQGFLF